VGADAAGLNVGPPPLRFGINVRPWRRTDGSDPVEAARHAEHLGFDLVTVSDHLHGRAPSSETWTLLTWIASRTERIAVAPIVLGLPYRPPPVLAKMAESLDRLSGGRLILGLGGGGSNAEFGAFGLDVRSPGEKVDAMEEAIHVLRGMWREGTFTFEGSHFRTREAQIEPKAERDIPIWLGSYGKRSLGVLGRLADGWIPSMPFLPPARAVEGWKTLRAAAEEAGRDPDEIVWAYNIGMDVGGTSDDDGTLSGPPEAVAEGLAKLIRMGVRFPIFWTRERPEEQRELLAAEVFPAVRREIADA
jgi:alkanesulfonate monooxygenase SsuD/methylene tetrahydromethanopterin reductase-like flavin-dependent oxidoreductase (luciferase family)